MALTRGIPREVQSAEHVVLSPNLTSRCRLWAVARQVLAVAGADERIAVIGAGAAGAQAARVLAQRGVDVILIEARIRTGGRVDSRATEADAAPLFEQLLADFGSVTGADAGDHSSSFLSHTIGEARFVPMGPMAAVVEDALSEVEPSLSHVVGVFCDDGGRRMAHRRRGSRRAAVGQPAAGDR